MTRTATTTKQPRQPRGVPIGGEFAARAHGEAEVNLDDLSGLTVTDDLIFRFAAEAARNEARRYPGQFELDDLTQDICEHYMARRNKYLDAFANGDESAASAAVLVNHPGPYIQTIAHGLAQRKVTGVDQSYERSAVKEYLDAKRALEQQLGVELTSEQEDDIAEQVRLAQQPGRRAKEGFHRSPAGRDLSLDDHGTDDERADSHGLRTAASAWGGELGVGLGGEAADGTMAALLQERVDRGMASAAEARRDVWNAIAETRGAPQIAFDSMSESDASKARKAIAEHGGAVAVARMWSNETAETDGEKAACNALFAPFGDKLSFDEQAAVVSTVISLRDSGSEHLLDAAIGAATRKRKKT